MIKIKNLLGLLLNPRLYILLYLTVSLVALMFFGVKYVKKLTRFLVLKQETQLNKNERKPSEKIYLNNYQYSSLGYSMDTNDKEKTITTAGIICILPNGNILHAIMTGENVDGRMKNTEETIDFLTYYQDEIFDDIARTIVEAGQKPPPTEPKKKPFQNEINEPVKKKV